MAAGKPYDYVGTVWSFGDRTTINGGLSRYLPATGGTSMASELAVVALHDGMLKNLRWSCSANSLSGVGAGGRITVYVNGAATPLEATWIGTATSGSGTPDLIAIAAGDRFSVRIQPVGAGSITRPRVSFELELPSAIPWKSAGTNLYYDGGGRVGIGTSSPGKALSVNGAIECMAGGFKFPDGSVQSSAFTAIESLVPPGAVIAYAGDSVPSGWLLCDGSHVDRTSFAGLFAAIGTGHGEGDGTTTFALPDFRGYFLRGVSGTSGNDPEADNRGLPEVTGGNVGNAVGSKQWSDTATHRHWLGYGSGDSTSMVPGGGTTQRLASFADDGWNDRRSKQRTDAWGGAETRPLNAYVHFLIKT
jgi:microcystin-dependent protein